MVYYFHAIDFCSTSDSSNSSSICLTLNIGLSQGKDLVVCFMIVFELFFRGWKAKKISAFFLAKLLFRNTMEKLKTF